MTCAKRKVVCLIRTPTGTLIRGENWCANPQDVCPRAPGEGYAKCLYICRQSGHAEVDALKTALRHGVDVLGGEATLFGHYWICEACGKALKEAGVRNITIQFRPWTSTDDDIFEAYGGLS